MKRKLDIEAASNVNKLCLKYSKKKIIKKQKSNIINLCQYLAKVLLFINFVLIEVGEDVNVT